MRAVKIAPVFITHYMLCSPTSIHHAILISRYGVAFFGRFFLNVVRNSLMGVVRNLKRQFAFNLRHNAVPIAQRGLAENPRRRRGSSQNLRQILRLRT
jgi:hypothetical protein